jgi:hypothetical protein
MSKAVIHGDTVYLAGIVADNPKGRSTAEQTRSIFIKAIVGSAVAYPIAARAAAGNARDRVCLVCFFSWFGSTTVLDTLALAWRWGLLFYLPRALSGRTQRDAPSRNPRSVAALGRCLPSR